MKYNRSLCGVPPLIEMCHIEVPLTVLQMRQEPCFPSKTPFGHSQSGTGSDLVRWREPPSEHSQFGLFSQHCWHTATQQALRRQNNKQVSSLQKCKVPEEHGENRCLVRRSTTHTREEHDRSWRVAKDALTLKKQSQLITGQACESSLLHPHMLSTLPPHQHAHTSTTPARTH